MRFRKFVIYNLQFAIKGCLWAAIIAAVLCTAAYADNLADAQKDYIYGDYQDSLDKLNHTRSSGQVLYLTGMNYLKMGDYDNARKCFSRIMESNAQGELNNCAEIKYADTYFLDKDFVRAKKLFQDLEHSPCAKSHLPLIYLRLAQIAVKEGDWAAKKDYLSRIKTHFPNAVEMKYMEIMEKAPASYTVQVGAFGSMRNAQSIKADIYRRNDVYIVTEPRGSMTIYKVRVGKFTDRNEAEKLCAKLVNDGYPAIVYP